MKNISRLLFALLSLFMAGFASAATVWDGIVSSVTQPLLDAGTVIVSLAGGLAVLFVGWRVAKMLLSFVRG